MAKGGEKKGKWGERGDSGGSKGADILITATLHVRADSFALRPVEIWGEAGWFTQIEALNCTLVR